MLNLEQYVGTIQYSNGILNRSTCSTVNTGSSVLMDPTGLLNKLSINSVHHGTPHHDEATDENKERTEQNMSLTGMLHSSRQTKRPK